jgi:hypothetical protein
MTFVMASISFKYVEWCFISMWVISGMQLIVFAELEEWYNCCVCIAETHRADAVCGMAW